jgi:hypothetical protein
MINFYEFYNKTGLDKEEYSLLIANLMIKEYGHYEVIEHIIKKSPEYSYWYANRCLNGRWLEAESCIMKNAYFSIWYAQDVLKSRWIDAEPGIMVVPWGGYLYACQVINDRWIEAEPYIKTHAPAWSAYCKRFEI